MKVTIDKEGVLEIKAETGLESYALKCWINRNLCKEERNAHLVSTDKFIIYAELEGELNGEA